MAQRRMFSDKIVDTDAFLDMGTGSQLLYFHLCMRADDDGFVSNPKKIMRMIGSPDDDYKILLAKKFVIQFESGVCVIKHWLIHNLLRLDRYNETQYVKEKKMLVIDESTKKYSLIKPKDKEWQPNGNQMAPQVRLGKDRIGKEESETKVSRSLQELSYGLPKTVLGGLPEPSRSPLAIKEEKKLQARLSGKYDNTFGTKAVKLVKHFCVRYSEKYGRSYGKVVQVDTVAKNISTYLKDDQTVETLMEMIDAYFESKKGNDLPIKLTTAFSDDTYRSWTQGKMGNNSTGMIS